MHDHLAGIEQKAPQLFQISAAPYQKPHDHQTQFLVDWMLVLPRSRQP